MTSDSIALADLQRTGDQVTAASQRWLVAQPADAPWFLWVHYYDPHLPYSAPSKFTAAAPNRPYDAEIAFTDAQLGQLIAGVDRSRTAIVVTADHGESLGDHGEPDHGLFPVRLHARAFRSSLPARAFTPRVVTEQVRHIDVAPTIAALAGTVLPRDEGSDGGESLVPLLKGGSRTEVPALDRGELVPAPAFRLERVEVGPGGGLEVHRGTEARAVRSSRRSR